MESIHSERRGIIKENRISAYLWHMSEKPKSRTLAAVNKRLITVSGNYILKYFSKVLFTWVLMLKLIKAHMGLSKSTSLLLLYNPKGIYPLEQYKGPLLAYHKTTTLAIALILRKKMREIDMKSIHLFSIYFLKWFWKIVFQKYF